MEVSQCLMPLTQEVMEVLKEVKDPGLGKDIVAWRLAIFQCELDVPFVLEHWNAPGPRSFLQVSCGFVGAIKADRVTGNISLVLEVDFFKAEVEEAGL